MVFVNGSNIKMGRNNMHLQHVQQIDLLTEHVLKKAEGSSPKMTGSPQRQRHRMSVGSVVWDIEYNTQ